MNEITPELYKKYIDNDYVENISKNIIHYSKYFYVEIARLMEEGLGSIEAYEKLGFDTNDLGKDRAYQVAKIAKKVSKDPNYLTKAENYDGSIEREDADKLPQNELIAYLKARNTYLEAALELQKKTLNYVENNILLKNKK